MELHDTGSTIAENDSTAAEPCGCHKAERIMKATNLVFLLLLCLGCAVLVKKLVKG